MKKWQSFKQDIHKKYQYGKMDITPIEMDDLNYNHVLIPLGEPYDISQGTGNVLIHSIYDVNDGKAYRYADF